MDLGPSTRLGRARQATGRGPRPGLRTGDSVGAAAPAGGERVSRGPLRRPPPPPTQQLRAPTGAPGPPVPLIASTSGPGVAAAAAPGSRATPGRVSRAPAPAAGQRRATRGVPTTPAPRPDPPPSWRGP